MLVGSPREYVKHVLRVANSGSSSEKRMLIITFKVKKKFYWRFCKLKQEKTKANKW